MKISEARCFVGVGCYIQETAEEMEVSRLITAATRNSDRSLDLGRMENKENVPRPRFIHPFMAPFAGNFGNHAEREEDISEGDGICNCCTTTKNSKSLLPLSMLSDTTGEIATVPPNNNEMKLPPRVQQHQNNLEKSGEGQYRNTEVIVIDSDSDDDLDPSSAHARRAQPSHRTSKGNTSDADSSLEAEWDGDVEYVHSVADDNKSEESSDSDTELIQRTKEIVILSDDDDDAALVVAPKPRRKSSTQRTIPRPLTGNAKPESKLAFRRRREELSQQLLVTFDRTVFDAKLLVSARGFEDPVVALSWSNKLRTTAGLTRLKSMGNPFLTNDQPDQNASRIRTALVELSTKVIDNETRLRSTLLHELCHAAAWIIDGIAKPAHGPCFQRWAKHAMKAVPDVSVTTRHNYEIDFKYTWVCVNYPDTCQTMIQRHSRSVDPERHVCGLCKGRLQEVSK
jgi:predicted SprT family Zn-dependent metalloprotease